MPVENLVLSLYLIIFISHYKSFVLWLHVQECIVLWYFFATCAKSHTLLQNGCFYCTVLCCLIIPRLKVLHMYYLELSDFQFICIS